MRRKHMADDGKGGYLVTEDDGTQHLPTKKGGSLDRGLCAAAWAALHAPGGFRGNKYEGPNKAEAIKKLTAIYKAQGWDLPDSSASMSAGDTEMVYRSGLIFKAGSYKDQQVDVTEEDIAAAVASFSGPL